MTNDERNPKPECRKTLSGAFAGFVIRILSLLRISAFVIRICEEWFMESLHSFLRTRWDHEPVCGTPLVWCPAFRRSEPAEAGTPNGRFMERKHWLAGLLGQAFPPANLGETQGIALGILLCVLGALCVRPLKQN